MTWLLDQIHRMIESSPDLCQTSLVPQKKSLGWIFFNKFVRILVRIAIGTNRLC
jgi:hypothetical protein